jgi:hypothetical protein
MGMKWVHRKAVSMKSTENILFLSRGICKMKVQEEVIAYFAFILHRLHRNRTE